MGVFPRVCLCVFMVSLFYCYIAREAVGTFEVQLFERFYFLSIQMYILERDVPHGVQAVVALDE